MIRTDRLTRTFRVNGSTVGAVRGIDLDVAPGELLVVLGPNGSGKSTTLRMLTTLLPPSSGTARVAGHDVTTEARQVRRRIGYVSQHGSAGEDQRVAEELVTQGRCHGMSRAVAQERGQDLLAQFQLDGLHRRPVGSLSGGQRRRLDIALGLMHQPQLLFLDEPSTGLDPHSRANLWEHIAQLRADSGATILLSTHYLDEADTTAGVERVVVLDEGRVIADGTPADLKAKVSGDLLTLTCVDAEHAGRVTRTVDASMPQLRAEASAGTGADTATGTGTEQHSAVVQLRVANGAEALPEVLGALHREDIPPLSAQVRRPTLDDVFLTLTGRSLREPEETAA